MALPIRGAAIRKEMGRTKPMAVPGHPFYFYTMDTVFSPAAVFSDTVSGHLLLR